MIQCIKSCRKVLRNHKGAGHRGGHRWLGFPLAIQKEDAIFWVIQTLGLKSGIMKKLSSILIFIPTFSLSRGSLGVPRGVSWSKVCFGCIWEMFSHILASNPPLVWWGHVCIYFLVFTGILVEVLLHSYFKNICTLNT